jgi:hypothetical protein
MASKSAPGLLSAIEGYSSEHAGAPEHEENIALLKRVAGEIAKGHGGDKISPGQHEAKAAAQKNMPSEENHSGGEGNKTTNAPGSFGDNEDVAEPSENSTGTENMATAKVAASGGHLESNLRGPAAASGKLPDMRRQAALKDLEKGPTSEGNKESNPPGKAGGNEKRIGDVKPAAKTPPDKNKGGDDFEGVPPFAKESLQGDGWNKAREKAKQMYASSK